jgi:hypothetical protein
MKEFFTETRTITYVHASALNNLNWILARVVHVEAGAEESSDSDSSSKEFSEKVSKFIIILE